MCVLWPRTAAAADEVPAGDVTAADEAVDAAENLEEPAVEEDDTLSTGQITAWSCITFGSYPQTEVVSGAFDAVDAYAVQDEDYLEDPDLYEALEQAEWNGDETEIDGVRYLRMNRDDAVSSASDSAGHYRWGSGDEWHYFRFDPIRWRVIGLEEGKAFLVADMLLDCQPYHAEDGPITWEKSTVRSWLNGLSGEENAAGRDYQGKGFLDRAFSDAEREAILPARNMNKPNARYGTDCGSDTEDYVFLLSNDDVFGSEAAGRHGFFPKNGKDDPAKRFRSTMYAKCRGAWWSSVNGYRGNSFWFMRTNGYTQESVTYICDFGYIYQRGTISTCEDAGILAAMWIDPAQAQYEPAGTVTSKDIQSPSSTDDTEGGGTKDQIVNPVVTADEEQPDGKSVTYSMIRFGNFPQAEVVPDPSEGSSDSIVDPALYGALEQADWTNGECEYEQVRYLRVPAADENPEENFDENPDDNGKARFRFFACEPLLWRVLEVRDGTALLLSDAAVDCEPFQEELRDVSWENCTLRSYLNGYGADENVSAADYSAEKDNFLDRAFSPEEQKAILAYPVRNEDNYYFGMDSGKETCDRIFIPAESELFVYDSSEIHGFSRKDEVPDRAKQFKPTDYAVSKGVWTASADDGCGNVFWITRTTGYTHANVVYVDESGYMYNRGILVTCSDAAVIPALVLDLDSAEYTYAGTFTIGS